MSKQNGKKHEKKLRNHVAIVLDESGSMNAMRREAIDAFNQQVKTILEAAKGQETTVSLVKFGTIVPPPVYWVQPVGAMRPITEEDYQPNGMTAMLDAVGFTIDRLLKMPDADDEDTSFLVVIISDGMENNSKKYRWEAVAERIQAVDRTDRWTFSYLGANQNLSQVSERMHIAQDNTSAFVASPQGMSRASLLLTQSQGKFFRDRASGMKSSKRFFNDDEPAGGGTD